VLHSPRWLTGGLVGPDASVMMFVVLTLMFLLFAWFGPSASRRESRTYP